MKTSICAMALVALIASPALAQTKRVHRASTAAMYNGQKVGQDPDALVRLDLIRDFMVRDGSSF